MRPVADAVGEAATMTFEQLGFILTLGRIDAIPEDAGEKHAMKVAFRGHIDGVLEVRLFGSSLDALSSNILASEDGAGAGAKTEVLAEFTNIVCGNMLPMIAGPEAVFDVGAPVPLDPASSSPVDEGPETVVVRMELEEGYAEFRVRTWAPRD